MATIELDGRYTMGATLYLRAGIPRAKEAWEEEAPVTPAWEQVLRAERRDMSPEQLAGLTTVRVVSVRRATDAHQRIVDESDGSVGAGETSICEVVS